MSAFPPVFNFGDPFNPCGTGGLNYYGNGPHGPGTSHGLADDTFAIDFAIWSPIRIPLTIPTAGGDQVLYAAETGITARVYEGTGDGIEAIGAPSNYVFVAVYPFHGAGSRPGIPDLYTGAGRCAAASGLQDMMQCSGAFFVYQYLHVSDRSVTVSPGQVLILASPFARMGASGTFPFFHTHLGVYMEPSYRSAPIQFSNVRFDDLSEAAFGERFLSSHDNGRCVRGSSFAPWTALGNPLGDLDSDRVINLLDNCALFANADQADANADGIGDACCEEIILDPVPPGHHSLTICERGERRGRFIFCVGEDPDNDGLSDGDNCPCVPNAYQRDFDDDGIGDECDIDTDGDGVRNDLDTCPYMHDGAGDFDGDGLGDNCDRDDDGDGFADVEHGISCCGSLADLCLGFPDSRHASCPTDRNGAGDHDRDGVDSLADNCPCAWNPSQSDADGDGCGDPCDGDSLSEWLSTPEGLHSSVFRRDRCVPFTESNRCLGRFHPYGR